MTRATDRFLAEIRRSHEVLSYVDVTGPTGQVSRLKTTDGSVNCDRTGQYRRTATINCIDPLGVFVPQGNTGILTPFGTEVRPYRGVKYHNPDGSTETEVMPLGVFRLAKTTIIESSSAGVSYALEMFDRSRVVSRDKFTTPYLISTGTNLLDAIKLILARTFPNLSYDAVGTALTAPAPQVYDVGADPWQAVTDLATSMGCDIYFDATGWVVIAPPTDIDALPAPDFTYIEGQGSIMTDLQSVYSDDPGFNGVIVTGASLGADVPAVRAVAWDTEPSSPTYHLGPYGEVPMFVQDQNVTTVAAAQAEADSLLKGQLGFSAQLTVSGIVNPAYEAGNVVQVQRQKLNATGLYTIDAFNVPLKRDGIQNIVMRQRRGVGSG